MALPNKEKYDSYWLLVEAAFKSQLAEKERKANLAKEREKFSQMLTRAPIIYSDYDTGTFTGCPAREKIEFFGVNKRIDPKPKQQYQYILDYFPDYSVKHDRPALQRKLWDKGWGNLNTISNHISWLISKKKLKEIRIGGKSYLIRNNIRYKLV